MKVDALNLLSSAQSLVFWKNDGGPTSQAIQNNAVFQDAEDVARKEDTRRAGCPLPPFVPYTATLPWHSGPRNIFSRLFPRYGNYCGPNWSSGRESGSLHWDMAPVDWLDHCCYRHDMGYDTHDQEGLYKADVEFLKCLRNIPESERKNFAGIYQTVYILGLERFLIPYREVLIKKIKEGKGGRETAPDVIVEEVKHQNVEASRSA